MSTADILTFLGQFLAAHKDEWNTFAELNDKDIIVDDALMALIVMVLIVKTEEK
jgi:hypothetical protein